MKDKVKLFLQNEKGNIALYVLGMLSIIMILFIFILNMGSALAVKEKSATTAQQAALAATSRFYEEVKEVILVDEGHDIIEDLREELEELEEALAAAESESVREAIQEQIEKVEEALELLENFNSNVESIADGFTGPMYDDWSRNEKLLDAFERYLIDNVFPNELIGNRIFHALMFRNIEADVIEEARQTIEDNDGVLEGAVLEIEDDQIHIKAANMFESTSFDGIGGGIEKELYQESAGPKVDFLEAIWNGNREVELD